jgi:solute carrier family 12 (sodium/potassium/chloride transporter), member 2
MKRFGAFEGVFTPTILCILGVIMYLRLGWVVGQGGLRAALVIVVAANLISLLTGLSLSSMVTNIRIGAGGVYSLVTKSLGFEMGGAVGLPLFLAQAVSVAFYITGFAEGWSWIFPGHSVRLVSLIAWAVLFAVAFTSARLAFRLQFVMMAVIGLSLFSIFLSPARSAAPLFAAGLGEVSFWRLFAIFFPAVTGILAGVSMSGELNKPRRDIPLGTLAAIGIGFAIYLALTFWYAAAAAPAELAGDQLIAVNLARWSPLVLAGIMGATISSALSLMVAAPRVLYALASNRMLPFSGLFSRIGPRNEPLPAIVLASAIALAGIALGTLNAIAELLTMIFLFSYLMINLAVLVEQGIGIPSFRPAFRVPLLFPALGTVLTAAALVMINPLFSLISAVLVGLLYLFLLTRNVQGEWPDVRRGLLVFLAEKAVRTAARLPYHPKIWKPNLLVPVSGDQGWPDLVPFLADLAAPAGRLTLLRLVPPQGGTGIPACAGPASAGRLDTDGNVCAASSPLLQAFRLEGLLANEIAIAGPTAEFPDRARAAVAALSGSFLPPNLLFLVLSRSDPSGRLLEEMMDAGAAAGLGLVLLRLPTEGFAGEGKDINLWLRPGSPNIHLGVLIALQLQRNRQGHLRLVQVVKTPAVFFQDSTQESAVA